MNYICYRLGTLEALENCGCMHSEACALQGTFICTNEQICSLQGGMPPLPSSSYVYIIDMVLDYCCEGNDKMRVHVYSRGLWLPSHI